MIRFRSRAFLAIAATVGFMAIMAWLLIQRFSLDFWPDGWWIRNGKLVVVDFGSEGRIYGPFISRQAYDPWRYIVIPLWLLSAIVCLSAVVGYVLFVRLGPKHKQK